MWDLPGLGLEPTSPALAGGFLTTAPAGKSQYVTDFKSIAHIQKCENKTKPNKTYLWPEKKDRFIALKAFSTFIKSSYLYILTAFHFS